MRMPVAPVVTPTAHVYPAPGSLRVCLDSDVRTGRQDLTLLPPALVRRLVAECGGMDPAVAWLHERAVRYDHVFFLLAPVTPDATACSMVAVAPARWSVVELRALARTDTVTASLAALSRP